MTIEPITIIVDGVPIPKGRPRMTRRGHAFTPEATRNYEHTIGWAAKVAMGSRVPITTPVSLTVQFDLPIPPSWSKRKRVDAITGVVLPATRPDLDNFVKALLDGINGIVLSDDALITDLQARKAYCVRAKVVATVTPLNGVQRWAGIPILQRGN